MSADNDMPPRLRTRTFTLLAMFCSFGASSAQDEYRTEEVALLIADAARCIFYPHFDAPTLDDMFDERELEILANYTKQINVMIREALGRSDSVCGAYFSRRFGLTQNLDLLRAQILRPGRFYGWEGSYTAGGEHQYADEQYVYDSKYISVVESLAGKPIRDVIKLTDKEKASILSIANDPYHDSHEWALWILRKLGIF